MKLATGLPKVAHFGLVLACLCCNVAARSLQPRAPLEVDPMMPLPSGGLHQAPPQGQEVRYMTYQTMGVQPTEHQPEPAHQQAEVVLEYQASPGDEQAGHEQPAQQQQPQQQFVYAQQATERQPEESGAQANPSGAVSPGSDYAGQIVYVAQNPDQADGDALAGVAGSLDQNSGLAATILTEVPVRDMPHEVLMKMRREYGVRVVATRERPGANLVISCEDHSASHESAICHGQVEQAQVYQHAGHEHQLQRAQPPAYEYLAADHRQPMGPPEEPPHQEPQEHQEQPPQHVHTNCHHHSQRPTQSAHINHEMAAPADQAREAPDYVPNDRRSHSALHSHRGAPEQPQGRPYTATNEPQEGAHEPEEAGEHPITPAAAGAYEPANEQTELRAPQADRPQEELENHEQPNEAKAHMAGHESPAHGNDFDELSRNTEANEQEYQAQG